MRMPIRLLALVLPALFVGGCIDADAGPEVKAESIKLNEGQSITVDRTSHANSQERIQLTATQDGVVFVHSTIFPDQSDATDLSGTRRVYLFVPGGFVAAAKEGGPVRVTQADGLLAMEYSKNDAFPESYCFQQLSEGEISLRTKDGGAEIVIESHLKTPSISEPSDSMCDVSEFMNMTTFSLPNNGVNNGVRDN